MSGIHLLRHGQASFDADDYDVLSPLGEQQSVSTGKYLAETQMHFDQVFVGPRKRQIDTARLLASSASEAGHRLPDPESLDDLDEFPAIDIFRASFEQVTSDQPALAGAMRSTDTATQRKAFRDLFNVVAMRWARDELDIGDLERFPEFCRRIDRGLSTIRTAQGRGKNALVVTSGGPISVAVRTCLGLDPDNTMRIALVVANASMTRLEWRDEQMTLFGFNHTHHLSSEQLTYR